MNERIRVGRPGGLRLIVLRALLSLLCAAPVALAAHGALEQQLGGDPRMVAFGARPPIAAVGRVASEVVPLAGGVAAGLALVFLVLDQYLASAALVLLEPGSARVRVWRTLREDAGHYVPAFLRIALLALVVFALGAAGLGKLFEWLGDVATRDGWRGTTWMAVVVQGRLLATVVWLFVVAAFSRWARILCVAGDERRVHRLAWRALKVVRRAPFRTALWFVLLPLLLQLAGGALLAAHAAGGLGYIQLPAVASYGLWVGLVLLQATLWYVLLHRARLLLTADRLFAIVPPGSVAV